MAALSSAAVATVLKPGGPGTSGGRGGDAGGDGGAAGCDDLGQRLQVVGHISPTLANEDLAGGS
eukprot:2025225-Prymnesium_polylepis.2